MTIICSVGRAIPKYEIAQNQVKDLVQKIFQYSEREVTRLLPVFDNASIQSRQFVVEEDWFLTDHSFEERNGLYQQYSIDYATQAMDDCLQRANLIEAISYEDIDLLSFVSSTGVSTPSVDAYLMNKRPFRPNVDRMPLWGLGCAGGAIGLSRVFNWLKANPSKVAMLVTCELCSLTFQKTDNKKSNLVGTALFGDGISAVLLIGEKSPFRNKLNKPLPVIQSYSSYTAKNSTDVMGWKVVNTGFEVIFSKSIPTLVNTVWKPHMEMFLQDTGLQVEDIHSVIAHPGGKKVIEAMINALHIPKERLKYTYKILEDHGNMSSSTVLYVLREWLQQDMVPGNKGIVCALGPGFSSEILLLEWDE
ncbi:type III polyketide synthase [Ornithinibacillus massiliensis]|uniref:Type III polyketide synthase n=1 Tax=Ornithinibacillus massiliensis TaxID=1944633 RepID=A0ABS5MBR1_9BACI|nr:3-oxoacyl-[acyl-carrier-protein] synthase III C-terminal domain-containing protein [Ornithinibacillus massiliensis]MBS3679761.1 type III polyketide synthase [Ornithinibacillus massiliensis]